MKTFLVLAFLPPLSACVSAPWSSLDADPASPTSLRAPEAPPPRLVAVLADADPLRAPPGIGSEAQAQGGDHTGHHGHHGGHGGGTRQGAKAGQTPEHTGHFDSAPDAGTPASGHGHHQH